MGLRPLKLPSLVLHAHGNHDAARSLRLFLAMIADPWVFLSALLQDYAAATSHFVESKVLAMIEIALLLVLNDIRHITI